MLFFKNEEKKMLSEKMTSLIKGMPKAENHIHIEGSIPWDLALKLGKKNKVTLPFSTLEGIKKWTYDTIISDGLNGFMTCDRMINSVCLHEEDYEAVILALAKDDKEQNIIYQELHLDYPLNEERGIPMNVVMNGYRSGQQKAMELYGVEIVYIAGLDRTLSSEKCLSFVKNLSLYKNMVAGLGMDCEERNDPCIKHLASYEEGKRMGLFLTAHAGEDGDADNIRDALFKLHVQRIDHGCRAAEQPDLISYLKDHKILCAMCPSSNIYSGSAKSFQEHPFKTLLRAGVPVSISSDDPPYTCSLSEEILLDADKMELTEDEVIQVERNAFQYSICGQKYLTDFDSWINSHR